MISDALIALANYYWAAKNPAAARQILERAVRLAPSDTNANRALGARRHRSITNCASAAQLVKR